MSFTAYIANIEAKTGKTPADFRVIAEAKGFMDGATLKTGTKASVILDWLKRDFDLGRGHGMAIYALLKGMKKL